MQRFFDVFWGPKKALPAGVRGVGVRGGTQLIDYKNKALVYLYLECLLPLRYGAFYWQPGGLVPRARGRIPESTPSGDLKVHSAPGALTNVVRRGRGFGGNHAAGYSRPGIYRRLGFTFEVKKRSKSIHDNVCVFVFRECVLRLFVGVSGVLGKLFGLHRHDRIAYMLFSRKPLKVSDTVRRRLQTTLDLGALGESFFVLFCICGRSCC